MVFCLLVCDRVNRTTEDVNYVPITSTSPASNYWRIDQFISYDGATILNTTAGIVDTGALHFFYRASPRYTSPSPFDPAPLTFPSPPVTTRHRSRARLTLTLVIAIQASP